MLLTPRPATFHQPLSSWSLDIVPSLMLNNQTHQSFHICQRQSASRSTTYIILVKLVTCFTLLDLLQAINKSMVFGPCHWLFKASLYQSWLLLFLLSLIRECLFVAEIFIFLVLLPLGFILLTAAMVIEAPFTGWHFSYIVLILKE